MLAIHNYYLQVKTLIEKTQRYLIWIAQGEITVIVFFSFKTPKRNKTINFCITSRRKLYLIVLFSWEWILVKAHARFFNTQVGVWLSPLLPTNLLPSSKTKPQNLPHQQVPSLKGSISQED